MKEKCLYTCLICFLNICVFLYAGGHLTFTIFDVIIEGTIYNGPCSKNNNIPGLFRNENNAVDDSDHCGNLTIALLCNTIFIIPGGVICYIIWFAFNIIYFTNRSKMDKTINQIKSQNESLQTKLADKTLKIADLQRQLANRRTDRRPGRIENSLPPYTE